MLQHLSREGYQGKGFVPEVHHCVAAHQRVHKADHVMSALGTLLCAHFVGDDVQPFVHLQGGRKKNARLDQI